MIIKEKRYIKKCDCGTEIIYTRRDCYHNTTWDIYSLYCPSCSHEYSYRRGTHHDLFDKEYEEDSVDKDEEIERLKRNGQRVATDYAIEKAKADMYMDIINEIKEMIEQYSYNAYYYKCDSQNKFFKSEIINDLKKILDKVSDEQ